MLFTGDKVSTEYYAADGRYADSEGEKGNWTADGDVVCVNDQSERRCWTVVIMGTEVMWYSVKSGALESKGSLVSGNPSNL